MKSLDPVHWNVNFAWVLMLCVVTGQASSTMLNTKNANAEQHGGGTHL